MLRECYTRGGRCICSDCNGTLRGNKSIKMRHDRKMSLSQKKKAVGRLYVTPISSHRTLQTYERVLCTIYGVGYHYKSHFNHLRIGVFKSPVLDFLRHSPTHSITRMIMIIANTAATATTTYSHTCRGVVGCGSVELSVTIFDVRDVGGLLVSGEVEEEVTSPAVTFPVVTVGGGVGRGLEFRLGHDVTSVWVVDVISSMGIGVTEGEGDTVIGALAQLVGSVWKNIVD